MIGLVRARSLLAAVGLAATLSGGAGARALAATSPVGAHSMIQLTDPPALMNAMFAKAAALGAAEIRVDVAPGEIYGQFGETDWSGLDEVMALSTEYRLPVLGDLTDRPSVDCSDPAAAPAHCGLDGNLNGDVAQIVERAYPVIRDWEVWNEPDATAPFNASPSQYALMLRTLYHIIHYVAPSDRVLLGGVSGVAATRWLAQVFATPQDDAAHAFDIADLHEHNRLDRLAADVTAFRRFLAGAGFTGPLWVTEHGYPSDPASQYDPAYAHGAVSQAQFLTASVPTLLSAGVSQVFVTERDDDSLLGRYASEGLLDGQATADPDTGEKPAYVAVRALAGCYERLGRDCPEPPPVTTPSTISLRHVRLGSLVTTAITVSDRDQEPIDVGVPTVTEAVRETEPASIGRDTCARRLIEPGTACAIVVRASAASGGVMKVILHVPSDQGTAAVPITAAVPTVSALRVARGPFRAVGSRSRAVRRLTATIVVRNPLATAVRVDSVRLAGSPTFSLTSDTCVAVTLLPGHHCRIRVRWSPGAVSLARATVTLRGDGAPSRIALRAGR